MKRFFLSFIYISFFFLFFSSSLSSSLNKCYNISNNQSIFYFYQDNNNFIYEILYNNNNCSSYPIYVKHINYSRTNNNYQNSTTSTSNTRITSTTTTTITNTNTDTNTNTNTNIITTTTTTLSNLKLKEIQLKASYKDIIEHYYNYNYNNYYDNLRLLSSSITSPTILTLTNTEDSLLSNEFDCLPSFTSSGINCTLRSALNYCLHQSNNNCEIYLPSLSNIQLTKGDLQINSTKVISISLYGSGSTITPLFTSNRFMTLQSSGKNGNISMSIFDLSLKNFQSNLLDGGVIYINNITYLLLQNISFSENNGRYGGVIYATSTSNIYINNCTFFHNTALYNGGIIYGNQNNKNWFITNSKFYSNYATNFETSGGGVIYLNSNNNNWIILKSSFYSNTANLGGVILAYTSNLNIKIISSIFISNNANYDGSIILITNSYNTNWLILNSTFLTNSAYRSGLIDIQSNNNHYWNIFDSKFISNLSIKYGLISLESNNNNNWNFENNYFKDNDSPQGGIIYSNSNNNNFELYKCYFISNSALSGGVLFLNTNNNYWKINNSTFIQNSASLNGGSIYANSNNTHILLSNCIFYSNFITSSTPTSTSTLNGKGGVIYLNLGNSNWKIINSFFLENSALYGGVLYSFESSSYWSILNTSFINNQADLDGGVFYIESKNINWEIINCNISKNNGNIKTGYGGGIYLGNENNEWLFNNIYISDNKALDGAGIYLFNKNSNTTFINVQGINNIATRSGAVIFSNILNDNIKIINCYNLNNYAGLYGGSFVFMSWSSYILINNGIFQQNKANIGGSIYFGTGNNKLTFEDNIFLYNTATELSGGISFSELNQHIKVINNTFQSNFVGNFGGGMSFVNHNSNILIDHCNFKYNKALLMGASIYFESTNTNIKVISTNMNSNEALSGAAVAMMLLNQYVYFTSCNIINNKAYLNGGAFSILLSNQYIIFEETIISSNRATLLGGAIFLSQSNMKIILSNSTLLKNNSADNGGAIYISEYNTDINIYNTKFQENYVKTDGGVIYLSGHNDKFTIRNSLFLSNHAYSSGGGIISYSTITILNCNFTFNSAQIGGSLYLTLGNDYVLSNLLIQHSTSDSIGGGIYFYLVSRVFMSNIQIINSYSGHGGAIYFYKSSVLQIYNSSFINNQVTGSGGAIDFSYSNSIDIISCIFKNNLAKTEKTSSGGGISFDHSAYIYINKLISINNTAEGNGGGLNFTTCHAITIINSYFNMNKVLKGSGSAIWLSDSSNNIISNNTFEQNKAIMGNGVVYWNYSPISLIEPSGLSLSNIFKNNYANLGGDIASSPCFLTLKLSNNNNDNSNNDNNNNNIENINNDKSIVLFSQETNQNKKYILLADTSSTFLDTIQINIVDFYGKIYNTNNNFISASTNSTLNDCNSIDETLKGEISTNTELGIGLFDGLIAICKPGGKMVIDFTTKLSDITTTISLTVHFKNCTDGDYLESSRCLRCPLGSYSLKYNSDKKCHNGCPEGTKQCYGNTFDLEKGWWRKTNTSKLLFQCPSGVIGCLGGELTGDSLCSKGSYGPLCGVCMEGYYYDTTNNNCVLCSNSSINTFSIILVICGSVIAIGIFWYLLITQAELMDIMIDISIVSLLGYIWKHYLGNRKKWNLKECEIFINRISTKTKLYVTLFQILSSLPFVLNYSFPPFYSKIVKVGSIVNLNIFNDVAVKCDYDYDFIDFLLMATITPMCTTTFIIILYFLHYLFLRYYRNQSKDSLKFLFNNYLKLLLVGSFLLLPGISIYIFQTFSCLNIDPNNLNESYLRVDYSISCSSSRYEWARSYAIVMVFIYPVGTVAFYYWLLYSNQKLIQNRNELTSEEDLKTIEPLAFLYSAYEPKFWYWEVIETSRRVVLTGLLVLFQQGSSLQIVIAFILSLLFMKLYGHFAPFDDDYIDVDGEFAQFQTSTIFFIVFLLKTGVIREKSSETEIFLILTTLAIFTLPLIRFYLEYLESPFVYRSGESPRGYDFISSWSNERKKVNPVEEKKDEKVDIEENNEPDLETNVKGDMDMEVDEEIETNVQIQKEETKVDNIPVKHLNIKQLTKLIAIMPLKSS